MTNLEPIHDPAPTYSWRPFATLHVPTTSLAMVAFEVSAISSALSPCAQASRLPPCLGVKLANTRCSGEELAELVFVVVVSRWILFLHLPRCEQGLLLVRRDTREVTRASNAGSTAKAAGPNAAGKARCGQGHGKEDQHPLHLWGDTCDCECREGQAHERELGFHLLADFIGDQIIRACLDRAGGANVEHAILFHSVLGTLAALLRLREQRLIAVVKRLR
mmetsp:Transcript_138649/g.351431  ORF Transcript_138649/g.351431 Transcript_138649/m.351431 type:complete len:220 (-) Transcript_138649:2262-2921(-)